MPSRERIHQNRFLRIFGALLHQHDLWYLNRNSVARAFAIGLFWTAMPMPFQMIPAAGFAILFRANLALSVALVWLTNPVTIGPVMYSQYVIGSWVLGTHIQFADFSFSLEWLKANFAAIWKPLYVGALLTGTAASLLSYLAIQGLWRWNILRKLKARRVIRLHHKRQREARRGQKQSRRIHPRARPIQE